MSVVTITCRVVHENSENQIRKKTEDGKQKKNYIEKYRANEKIKMSPRSQPPKCG